jgi:TonB family protein
MSDYKNDIEKYLRGELSPAEMHALEKRALDDPFLADALEGVQQVSSDELATDLSLLQASLSKRVQKQKNGWIWPMRIAAGLLLIAASTYFIISVYNPQSDKNLALHKEKELQPTPLEKDSDSPVSDSVADRAQHEVSKPEITKSKGDEQVRTSPPTKQSPLEAQQPLAQSEKFDESVASDAEVEEPKPKIDDEVLAEEQAPASSRREGLAYSARPNREDADTIALEKKKTDRLSLNSTAATRHLALEKTSKRVIKGKVTLSEDGTGIPGVNVMVKGSNQGTVTDEQGNYILPLDEQDASLIFSFIGFTSKEIESKSNELNVQLEPDISELSEVVVVGDPSAVEEGFLLPNPPPVMELAGPAGGRKLFKQYLQENLNYPQQAIANQVEGKVTIQFSIGTTGQLSDFKVLRGIGFGCDEEVIRLIKEGPKWSPTKKNDVAIRDKVKVRMKFALPKK